MSHQGRLSVHSLRDRQPCTAAVSPQIAGFALASASSPLLPPSQPLSTPARQLPRKACFHVIFSGKTISFHISLPCHLALERSSCLPLLTAGSSGWSQGLIHLPSAYSPEQAIDIHMDELYAGISADGCKKTEKGSHQPLGNDSQGHGTRAEFQEGEMRGWRGREGACSQETGKIRLASVGWDFPGGSV